MPSLLISPANETRNFARGISKTIVCIEEEDAQTLRTPRLDSREAEISESSLHSLRKVFDPNQNNIIEFNRCYFILHSSIGHPDKSVFKRKIDVVAKIGFKSDLVTSFTSYLTVL